MKTQDRDTQIDEALWLAQEKARHGDADADALDLRIAHALRTPPPVALPQDFAARVAALAQSRAVADSRLEQGLLRGLVVVFALSATVVVAWFGRGWVASLVASLPGGQGALGWSVLVACCVLGNWAIGGLRRSFEQAPRTAN